MAKYEIMVLACEVCPFHLKFTQINSEMNCIAKHKCTKSQKLDTRRRGENLNSDITRIKSNNMYIFLHSDTRKASSNLTFILKQSLILSSVCVIIVTRPIGDSH